MLNTQVVSGATDNDLVVLDLVFHDETFETSAPIKRYEAHKIMRLFGEYGATWGPYEKPVKQCTILEYEVSSFDPNLPVH